MTDVSSPVENRSCPESTRCSQCMIPLSWRQSVFDGWTMAQWLTHWGRVTHICVGKLTTIGSNNGLSPGRWQTIIGTNAGILLIRTLGTNFSEILSEIEAFLFKKRHLKISSAKWWQFCLGLNVLRRWQQQGRGVSKITGSPVQHWYPPREAIGWPDNGLKLKWKLREL